MCLVELFAGLHTVHLAAELEGWQVVYSISCENNPYSNVLAKKNWPLTIQLDDVCRARRRRKFDQRAHPVQTRIELAAIRHEKRGGLEAAWGSFSSAMGES